ncbi:histone deacetylase complex subunit SAP130-like [Uloborus diversus]|uniref:histone deacetylase complex subunit SAP130-like n=1 Tax=Uloborus diversus TaxID=327109 RepID=UPI0024092A5B|nr:histone deacetylase complex subunit SAP130-like [Uloborus diversus]
MFKNMNNQKPENKATEHEDADHTQPINLVAARTPVTTFSGSGTAAVTQPVRTHLEPKPGVMTLYFRTPTPRPQGQVMAPVGAQVSTSQHFTSKPGTDFKNAHSFTVIRMPASDIAQAQVGTTTASSCGALTPGILPSALTSSGSRHIIPAVHPVIAAGNTGPSMASIIRGSQVSPAGHVIHPPFSSHVPRGPAAVASISAAPKSAVATPILRTPHSSATISSSSMMALHTPVRAKSPTVTRTATPPVASTSLPQVVDLQKSSIGHPMSSNTSHVGLASRTIDGSIVRTGTAHSSAITIAKPINISQPIVQHLQQVYDKGNLKTMSSLVASTSAPTNSSPAHQTVVPGPFSSVSESVGVVPTISRATVSTGYSTSIMQLSSAATVGQPLQQLRATHVPQAIHTLSNVNSSVTPHQTLTVISAKSLVPANHSVALATSAPRATVPATTVSTSGSSSIMPGPIRPLNISNTISPSTIPVAKVYPQSTTGARSNNDSTSTNTQENNRSTNFTPQPVVSNSARVATPTTSSSSMPQTVMLSENKVDSGSSVRFTSLTKPQVGNPTSYAPSPTTYLYHDQYATNLAMHPYTSSPNQGFTTTHLRPVSFAHHSTSNTASHPSISVSNSSQPLNSVMVAVDSRHHVSLHSPFSQNSGGPKGSELSAPVSMPSSSTSSSAATSATNAVTTTFNSLQAQNNHTSPRPSILRKRTSENVCSVAKKNLTDRLCAAEPASPRSDVSNNINFTSVLSPKPINDKIKEVLPPLIPASESQNLVIPVMPPSAIKKEPGLVENSCPMSESSTKDSKLMEASPRKKPRKQLLAANELMETHSSDGEENNFDVKMRIKEELGLKDDEKSKYVTYYKRPSMSLLSSYRQSWKARHNHFARYSDVKPKEEKKPTVNELANQKGVLQHVNGWKVYHLTAQMDEVINVEESVYSRLTDLLDFVENDPPAALRTRSLSNSDEDKILNKLTDLIKGNLQRSKIVQEQVSESKQQAIKVLDHKMNIVEMINKYISKRPLKKKEKT